ncbi:MAG TPA: M56 family metallopeptidase [Verrucomicrobiae bacterium]|nr:M56 family metallopeptidase [Verrucomicrobiae bacterium]
MRFIAEVADGLAGWRALLVPVVAKGFIILALVFVMMIFWRRSTAAGRHLAWTMAFVCLLCLPVFVQCLPHWNAPAWIVPASLNNNLPDTLSFILPNQPEPESKPPQTAPGSLTGAAPSAGGSRQPAPVKHAVQWSDIAVMIWFAVVMVGMTRLLAVQIRLARLARRMCPCEHREWLKQLDDLRMEYGIRRRVRLMVSETSTSPMTWGFWRPVIALPAESFEWPEERLRVVLRHELAHVKRWDCLTQEIAQLVCVVYWFNPLTWLAARRMRAEREKACDDFVLNTGAPPKEYATHLVEVARRHSSANWRGAVAMARPSGLEQRVTAILDGRRRRRRLAKVTVASIVLAILSLEILVGGCAKRKPSVWNSLKSPEVAAQMKSFVADKKSQESKLIEADEREFAQRLGHEDYKLEQPDCRPLFAAAATGDWPTVRKLWSELDRHTLGMFPNKATNGYPHGMWRQPVVETFGAVEAFVSGDGKYSKVFGDDIINSIPPGSIYFGGTDPGRFIVTAMQKSQVDGDPFFTLTQNALADGTYLNYLRSMYGEKIYIPTAQDSAKCFQEYTRDIVERKAENKLKPGENVQVDGTSGRVAVSGQAAVMQINGLLVKTIFDQETNRGFYIEESWPLDWMYPYLEPHGLIFKLNRQPLTELPNEIVQRDHDYWTKLIQPMIGDWLTDDTSVQDVADFAKKVFRENDLSGFTGDSRFVQNDYSCKMFSKERANIADLYVWRMNHATDDGEKERMAREADFAYRQALALCPYNSEAAKGYVDFLKSQNRLSDANLVSEMVGQFPSAPKPVSAETEKPAAKPPKPLAMVFQTNGTTISISSSNSSAMVLKLSVFQIRLVLENPTQDSDSFPMDILMPTGGNTVKFLLPVEKSVLLDETDVQSAKTVQDPSDRPSIEITLTAHGQRRFAEITRQNIGKKLAVFIAGQVRATPLIGSEISNGTIRVSGDFTDQKAKDLVAEINRAVGK